MSLIIPGPHQSNEAVIYLATSPRWSLAHFHVVGIEKYASNAVSLNFPINYLQYIIQLLHIVLYASPTFSHICKVYIIMISYT